MLPVLCPSQLHNREGKPLGQSAQLGTHVAVGDSVVVLEPLSNDGRQHVGHRAIKAAPRLQCR